MPSSSSLGDKLIREVVVTASLMEKGYLLRIVSSLDREIEMTGQEEEEPRNGSRGNPNGLSSHRVAAFAAIVAAWFQCSLTRIWLPSENGLSRRTRLLISRA